MSDPYDLPLATLGMPIHKATETQGPIKALCGGVGYNLAEKWENVRCEACTALRH